MPVINARARPMRTLVELRNGVPGPVWCGLVLIGFLVWWPLGLAVVAAALWSGTMGCCGMNFGLRNEPADRLPRQSWWQQPTSGNQTFDEYRAETLRRLEEEERDFHDFLARLRMAQDKAEFDQFMAERGGGKKPEA
jgi:hypothetical protein